MTLLVSCFDASIRTEVVAEMNLSVATREDFSTSTYHMRSVGELLAVEDECVLFNVKLMLVVAALVLQIVCAILDSVQTVSIGSNIVTVGVDFIVVVMNILTVTVDIDFNVGHLRHNLDDVLAEGFKCDEHVSSRFNSLFIGVLVEDLFACFEVCNGRVEVGDGRVNGHGVSIIMMIESVLHESFGLDT